ncbi:hypothetical protein [Laspinema olomoucense]|uniref:hypothetical protein n=1 Tax=Laspinema olomoucense TaxID=3231600 RepID=UPI0021BB1846|nr:hypothetical protein [Laspinema sp. D3d]MCT7971233.1 hypothetical protein [Laspinema sp. D3d]
MNHFFIKANKKDHLIKCLTADIRSNVIHHLFLITCFFNPESGTEIIKSLSRWNIKEISLYFDKEQAIRIGIPTLKEWQKNIQEEICKKSILHIYIFNPDSPSLFHPKLYSLIRLNPNGEVISGNLVVTSANLTHFGLICEHGNTESIFRISSLEAIKQFYQELKSLKYITLEELKENNSFADFEKFNQPKELQKSNNFTKIVNPELNNSFYFKYELLCCGKFLYKWTDNLNSCLSVRYRLTPKAKEKSFSLQKEFAKLGFTIEQATISKNYFDLTDEEKNHILDSDPNKQIDNLTKNYGIQTFLGYWIPKQFAGVLEERMNQYDTFANNLFKKLEQQLEDIAKTVQTDYENLLEKELILPIKNNIQKNLSKKIKSLQENPIKLKRIWSKYYLFELPYNSIENHEQIEILYDVLIETCNNLRNKKISVKAVLDAHKEKNLSYIINLINLA